MRISVAAYTQCNVDLRGVVWESGRESVQLAVDPYHRELTMHLYTAQRKVPVR